MKIKELRKELINAIKLYDERSGKCVSLIVHGVLDVEEPAPPGTKERLASSVASREALRDFGVKTGLLEHNEFIAVI